MSIPKIIETRLRQLSADCKVPLEVVQHWANEFRQGWYCRFRGVLHRSEAFLVEVAGTLAIELEPDRPDEVDLFLFVNGERMGLTSAPSKYLWRTNGGDLSWQDLDEGYQRFQSLDGEPWNQTRRCN